MPTANLLSLAAGQPRCKRARGEDAHVDRDAFDSDTNYTEEEQDLEISEEVAVVDRPQLNSVETMIRPLIN